MNIIFSQLLHIFIERNNQLITLKLTLNKDLYNISKEAIQKWKASTNLENLEKYVKDRSIVNINILLEKRTKEIYRNLFENSCKFDFFELFKVTFKELNTAKSVLKRVVQENFGNWSLVNIKRFLHEILENVGDIGAMEFNEMLDFRYDYIFRCKCITNAIKKNKLDNVEYFIECNGSLNRNYIINEAYLWSLKFNREDISNFIEQKYMNVLKQLELHKCLSLFFMDFTLKIHSNEVFIKIIKRLENIAKLQNHNYQKQFYIEAVTCSCCFNVREMFVYFSRKNCEYCNNCSENIIDHNPENMLSYGLSI